MKNKLIGWGSIIFLIGTLSLVLFAEAAEEKKMDVTSANISRRMEKGMSPHSEMKRDRMTQRYTRQMMEDNSHQEKRIRTCRSYQ